MFVIADTLLSLGVRDRDLYLFDTFTGMPPPTDEDVDAWGVPRRLLRRRRRRAVLRLRAEPGPSAPRGHGLPGGTTALREGHGRGHDPGARPRRIALCRLDTDFYVSTAHEMEHLFPRIPEGGVLLIDDYGHFAGSRKAVDEYFEQLGVPVLLHRIDYSGRMVVVSPKLAAARRHCGSVSGAAARSHRGAPRPRRAAPAAASARRPRARAAHGEPRAARIGRPRRRAPSRGSARVLGRSAGARAPTGAVSIGDGVVVMEHSTLEVLDERDGGTAGALLVLDDTVILARFNTVVCGIGVSIGERVGSSDSAAVFDTWWPGAPFGGFGPDQAPVVIERHAYLGCNSIVGPGVTVGEGRTWARVPSSSTTSRPTPSSTATRRAWSAPSTPTTNSWPDAVSRLMRLRRITPANVRRKVEEELRARKLAATTGTRAHAAAAERVQVVRPGLGGRAAGAGRQPGADRHRRRRRDPRALVAVGRRRRRRRHAAAHRSATGTQHRRAVPHRVRRRDRDRPRRAHRRPRVHRRHVPRLRGPRACPIIDQPMAPPRTVTIGRGAFLGIGARRAHGRDHRRAARTSARARSSPATCRPGPLVVGNPARVVRRFDDARPPGWPPPEVLASASPSVDGRGRPSQRCTRRRAASAV